MNKIKNLIAKYPFLAFVMNRYVLVLILFSVWMLFFDNYSYLEHHVLDKEIEMYDNLEQELESLDLEEYFIVVLE